MDFRQQRSRRGAVAAVMTVAALALACQRDECSRDHQCSGGLCRNGRCEAVQPPQPASPPAPAAAATAAPPPAPSAVVAPRVAKRAQPRSAERAPPVVPAAAPAPAPPPAPPLPGRAEKAAFGSRLLVHNDGDESWTACDIRFPDGRSYLAGLVPAHGAEGIMMVKFSRPAEPRIDHVVVKCDQGESRFSFSDPQGIGALKGYAEGGPKDRIYIHNTGDVSWSRCSARLPNGAYYVIGAIPARDTEAIMPDRFKKDSIPDTHVSVRCNEGAGRFALQ